MLVPPLPRGRPMRRFVKDLLKGLVIVVPVITTLWLVWLPVSFLDRLLGAPVPGVGFVLTAAGIWAVGVLASNRLGARVVRLMERLLARVPALEFLYKTVKDVVDAFVGEKRRFDRPVVVDLLPGEGVKALGFITRDNLEGPGLEDRIAVYLPQSYNIAGNLLILPRDRVTPLETDPGRFMTLIASGGVTGSERAARPEDEEEEEDYDLDD